MRHQAKSIVLFALAALVVTGCQGPDDNRPAVRLNVDPNLLTTDYGSGPRGEAALEAVKRAGTRFAGNLFTGSPMPGDMPESSEDPVEDRLNKLGKMIVPPKKAPSWSGGVKQPPRGADDDKPRPFTVRVKRGENLRLLSRWAGTTVEELRAENRSVLGRRRYCRSGDKIVVNLSANQKYAFDQERDKHQKQRTANYFATRYIDKVVLYRVKRGDSILAAAKRFGDVPLWLLSEFNQRNFRRLRPNEEILIPVVKRFEPGQQLPGQLIVLDEAGQRITGIPAEAARQRMNPEFLGRARVAIDDGNVFERRRIVGPSHRPDPVLGGRPGLQPGVPTAPTTAQAGQVKQWDLGGATLTVPTAGTATPQPVLAISPGGVAGPSAAAAAPPAPAKKVRSVLVKSKETFGHYKAWSGLSTNEIKNANPGLNPNLIFQGKKLRLPMTDDQYAVFVQRRSEAFLSPREKARRAQRRAALAAETQRKEALSARLAQSPQQAQANGPRPLRDRRIPASIRPAMMPRGGHVAPIAARSIVPKAKRRFHIVKSGDTVSRIALRWKLSLKAVQRLNPGMNPNMVRLGAKVRVR